MKITRQIQLLIAVSLFFAATAIAQTAKTSDQILLPAQVKLLPGQGGLPKLVILSKHSTAEIYLHGAHVASFKKNGEPPLLFLSAKSWFAAGKPIRGGVPIVFPWFGLRDGEPMHGFARISDWELAGTSVAKNGAVTIRLRLPKDSVKSEWAILRMEFVVTVADNLTMELSTTNESPDKMIEIENCFHTYFNVGDITKIFVTGLQAKPYDDVATGAGGARKEENEPRLRITKETNRIYLDTPDAVEIHDESLNRTIRVEKINANSTVVWNPWTTQKLPDDFDPGEHTKMVCVESGNVKQNKIFLGPGKSTALKVIVASRRNGK